MDLVAELGYVLRNYPDKAVDEALPAKSKLRLLYNAVLKGKVNTDAEAARLIYGQKHDAGDKKYVMLKRSLLRKLFELVLTSDGEGGLGAPHDIARDEAWRRLAIADKLLRENVYHNAERLLLKLLKDPLLQHEWDVLAQAHRLCIRLYALKGVPAALARHQAQHLQLLQAYQLEREALSAWEQVLAQAKYGQGRRADFADAGAEALQRLAAAQLALKRKLGLTTSSTLANALHAAMAFVTYHRADSIHAHAALSTWGRHQRSHVHSRALAHRLELTLYRARWAWAEGHSANTQRWLAAARQLSSYAAYSRFEVEALAVEGCIHSGRAGELLRGIELVQSVRAQPQFEFLHALDQAGWVLREVALYVATELHGHTNQAPDWAKALRRRWTVARLQADTAAVLSDRTGLALQQRLLSLCLLRLRGESLHDEALALEKYARRYLSQQPERRGLALVKALVRLQNRSRIAEVEWPQQPVARDSVEWIDYAQLYAWLAGER